MVAGPQVSGEIHVHREKNAGRKENEGAPIWHRGTRREGPQRPNSPEMTTKIDKHHIFVATGTIPIDDRRNGPASDIDGLSRWSVVCLIRAFA